MKFFLFPLAAIVSIGYTYAAENFAPVLPHNSKCIGAYADTYNQCRANALSVSCLPSDDLCNCRQAQNLAQCITFCYKDPSIYANLPLQKQVVAEWCSRVPSSILDAQPTTTTTAVVYPIATSGDDTQPTNIAGNTPNIFSAATTHSIQIIDLSIALMGMVFLLN